jgi:hypothetical protein
LALLPPLTGCTDGEATTPGHAQSTIISGHLSDAIDDGVVSVQAMGHGCTGTLIAPSVVLTALHCIVDFDEFAIINCKSDGTLASNSTGGDIGPLLDPALVSVVPGVSNDGTRVYAKKLFGTGTSQVCRDDLGIIVLESNLDIGSAPMVPLRFGPSKAGELTRAIGYGDTLGTSTEGGGRQVREDIKLLGVGAPSPGATGDVGIAPRTLRIGEGPCHGDSGGPLLSEETGAQIGIYSLLLSQGCKGSDVQNTYTQVAPFESFIRDTLDTVGQEPIAEVSGSTGGTGGDGGGPGGEAGSPAAGEGGAAASQGAIGGSGGTVDSGGSGGKGGSGAKGGKGGSSATGGSSGTDTTGGTGASGGTTGGTKDDGTGSGSRRDPACTCRVGPAGASIPWSVCALLAATLMLARRRYRR